MGDILAAEYDFIAVENPPLAAQQNVVDEHVKYAKLLIEEAIQDSKPPDLEKFQFPGQGTTDGHRDCGTVGIIGAGAGGLYAAMILQSLDIPYQILEASERTGGRIFTYKNFLEEDFPPDLRHREKSYFDVGAMRFPDIKCMERLFSLFRHKELNPPNVNPGLASHLVKYIFRDPNTFLHYNGIRSKTSESRPPSADTFRYGIKNGGNVQEDFINVGYEDIIREQTRWFVNDLGKDRDVGMRKLFRFDQYSVRGYMADCLKDPLPVIDWCETMGRSNGGYDLSLAQTILNVLPFMGRNVKWFSLKGGAQVLTDHMEAYINRMASNAIHFDKIVTGMKANSDSIEVKILGEKPRSFGHIISTIPLTCLRTLDLDECNLTFHQRNTIRLLQYEPAVKVGVKFLTPWWRGLKIQGGHSYTDRCVRIVVYPSSEDSTVLIASYCSSRDALLLGGLIGDGSRGKERLKELVLRDLAAIHDVDFKALDRAYVDIFGYDWGNAPFAQGAFAFFGPGQFSTLYKTLSRPAAGGRLHFAGEALSVRHAWVVGTLDASWRAVLEILLQYPEYYDNKLIKFFKLWGVNKEWNTGEGEEQNGRLLFQFNLFRDPELFVRRGFGKKDLKKAVDEVLKRDGFGEKESKKTVKEALLVRGKKELEKTVMTGQK